MANYNVFFTAIAEKSLDKLNRKLGTRILEKIKELSGNPRLPGTKKLKGENAYRLRVGNYRVVYDINDSSKEVTIYRIRHRKDVYR